MICALDMILTYNLYESGFVSTSFSKLSVNNYYPQIHWLKEMSWKNHLPREEIRKDEN